MHFYNFEEIVRATVNNEGKEGLRALVRLSDPTGAVEDKYVLYDRKALQGLLRSFDNKPEIPAAARANFAQEIGTLKRKYPLPRGGEALTDEPVDYSAFEEPSYLRKEKEASVPVEPVLLDPLDPKLNIPTFLRRALAVKAREQLGVHTREKEPGLTAVEALDQAEHDLRRQKVKLENFRHVLELSQAVRMAASRPGFDQSTDRPHHVFADLKI